MNMFALSVICDGFYFKVHTVFMYIQSLHIWCYLWFDGLLICIWFGMLLSWMFLFGSQPSWSFVVGVSMKLAVLISRMQGVLCGASWCSFLIVLWILGYMWLVFVSFIFNLSLLIIYMWYFSSVLECFPFIYVLIMFIVPVMVSYLCSVFNMWFEYPELLLLFLIACIFFFFWCRMLCLLSYVCEQQSKRFIW
jgi:hypothetical protein